MTRSRRTELMASHPRGWTVGLAVFAFSAVAVLATACGAAALVGPAARPTPWPISARRPHRCPSRGDGRHVGRRRCSGRRRHDRWGPQRGDGGAPTP